MRLLCRCRNSETEFCLRGLCERKGLMFLAGVVPFCRSFRRIACRRRNLWILCDQERVRTCRRSLQTFSGRLFPERGLHSTDVPDWR